MGGLRTLLCNCGLDGLNLTLLKEPMLGTSDPIDNPKFKPMGIEQVPQAVNA